MNSHLWIPGAAQPSLDRLVAGILRQIQLYTSTHTAERSHVEVQLFDGERYTLLSISAEPGFGFLTLDVHADDDVPHELIVPVGAIRRIELGPSDDPQRTGFALPPAGEPEEPEAPAAGP